MEFFLDNSNLFAPSQLTFGAVAPGHKGYTAEGPQQEQPSGEPPLVMRYINKLILGESGDREFVFLQELFERPFLQIHKHKIQLQGFGEETHSMGACFPGNYRLFVKANGIFQICPSCNDSLEIGSVDRGLDLDKVADIYERYYNLHNTECRRCWVYRFCPACYVSATRETGRFEATLDSQYCQKQRRNWEQIFSLYCHVIEQNPKAFDHTKDVQVVSEPVPVLDTPVS